MSNEQNKQNEDMEFEQMMEQRLHDNFSEFNADNVEISDERLKEMSKSLPSWSRTSL